MRTDLHLADSLQAFAPLRVDHADLEQAITEAVVQLREYNAWRTEQGMAPSTGPHIVFCFVAAHAPTEELRAVVLRWLDTMAGAPPAN